MPARAPDACGPKNTAIITNRLFSILAGVATFLLAGILIVALWDSRDWPYIHDTSLMLYAGWCLGEGAAPYRDLFDMNMPGTYLAMQALGAWFGWSDVGVRVADVLCTAIIAAGTFAAFSGAGPPPPLRGYGVASRLPAAAAALLFPLWYLRGGPSVSLQREALALGPLAVMFGLVESGVAPRFRALGTGVLAGLIVSIKPQLLLLAVPLIARLAVRARPSPLLPVARDFLAGIAVPVASLWLFLALRGSVGDFIDVATGYWPLYGQLNGDHQILDGGARLNYLVTSTWEGLRHRFMLLGLLGLAAGLLNPPLRGVTWTWAGLVAAAAIYPALSGQFWVYHWLPLHYALLGAAALALAPPTTRRSVLRGAQAAAAAATVASVAYASADAVAGARAGTPDNDVVLARHRVRGAPAEIGAFLQQHLVAGDRVQPLDWTGGAIHGMLAARATLATRFMYDFHFYHHVDDPYIGRLRRDFMRQMWSARPRFVIDVFAKRPFPSGPRTSTDFPELHAFLDEHYRVAHHGSTFRILEWQAPRVGDGASALPP